MNRMHLAKRAQVVGLLVEGMSMRATSRIADCSINTVTKLLCDVGAACAEFQDNALRNLRCERIQADEIWSFIGAKDRNLTEEERKAGDRGDVWTWTAMCADSKLMISWLVGDRSSEAAATFMHDVADRLAVRPQISADGLTKYPEAVGAAFAGKVDFAQVIKIYSEATEGQRRYSPPEVIGTKKTKVYGNPDIKHVSTSYVERQNLTMRMSCRRFTRLTNAFSKKMANHAHAVALHFMFYNFGRIHKTLRVTPAMQAGISDHVWSLEEIAGLVQEQGSRTRGPYKKRVM